MKKGIIHYGFGRDYLPNWGLKEALREIYQNFLDYGEYADYYDPEHAGSPEQKIIIIVKNLWRPESLEFLRIGNSKKLNSESIGKHGEGLKMAFLILLREGCYSVIRTPEYDIKPILYQDDEIGECFGLEYEEHTDEHHGFSIEFECPVEIFMEFRRNIIRPRDIIFDDGVNGAIVDKPIGNIYSGGLFVCTLKGFQNSYNVLPSKMPLDRDRLVPAAIDVNWATAKIKQAYGKFSAKDLTYTDSMYIDSIPEHVKRDIKPRTVGNSIEFTYKGDKGKTEIISNTYVKQQLAADGFFAAAIKKLKRVIAKQLGLYDMLIEFQKKHVSGAAMRQDFDLILEKVGKQDKIKRVPATIEDDSLPF